MTRKVSDEDFLAAWRELKSAAEVSRFLGINERAVHMRRRNMEKARGILLEASSKASPDAKLKLRSLNRRAELTVRAGTVVVFSDAHYWPGEASTAHRAMLKVIRKLKPAAVIANGDILDGATVSRHEPNGWEVRPTLLDELKAVQARLREIEQAAGKHAILHRTIGNHDIRFDRRLAGQVPEFKGIGGTSLADHIPNWSPSWSIFINEHTMVKHRWHNGIHAAYNNTLKAGTSIVTGHLHRLLVTRWADYNGPRYGVDTGTLAETDGAQFDYAEDNPRPWGSGFAVLTFDEDGRLLPPELCEVIDEVAYFRGAAV